MSAETRGTAPACAFVEIGFDRRAWPVGTSEESFHLAVRGYADDFRRVAPAKASPRMFTRPGVSTMYALFDGPSNGEVLARCKKTVAAYLPKAPRLPGTETGPDGRQRMPSAASVHIPCRPCD